MAHQTLGYTEGAGANVAIDRIAGEDFQRIKIAHGPEGEANDASEAAPVPVREISGADSTLSRILAVLMSPLGFDRSLGRQRSTAIIESGTVSTVTTCTTVSTVSNITAGTITTVGGLTNIDGRNGAMLINQSNLSAWNDCVRSRIT